MVKQAQKERQSANRTHWAAQFAVASELCKRGYEVALTDRIVSHSGEIVLCSSIRPSRWSKSVLYSYAGGTREENTA